MNKRIREIRTVLESRCWFLSEDMIDELISLGFSGLPCLIRRNLGRDVVRLKNLKNELAKNLGENDWVRDVSTWPEPFGHCATGIKFPCLPYK